MWNLKLLPDAATVVIHLTDFVRKSPPSTTNPAYDLRETLESFHPVANGVQRTIAFRIWLTGKPYIDLKLRDCLHILPKVSSTDVMIRFDPQVLDVSQFDRCWTASESAGVLSTRAVV
ncbi:hypothetical protein LTR09_000094 [Extremus antarcticus]|uniref:Uncharacterized protein n=1 Tax=Extremus antarcticus TaxID=702011 RepID=A0AAJ0LX12_9PEZI|nr:hypothetical protein LTR09_000094 [Extremus antarcticus]